MNKSKCIVFRQPQKTVEIPEFKIADNNIEVVDNFFISFLNIDKNLNWKNHIDCISIKISGKEIILNTF